MDPHKKEWELIRERYNKINTPEMKFRVECIDELLAQEKEKELAHFR